MEVLSKKLLLENGISFENITVEVLLRFQNITVEVLLRFLTFLFYTKGLKPSSVSHYRSALEQNLAYILQHRTQSISCISYVKSHEATKA